MAIDRMQKSRFELKYLVTEETALRIRDFVRCYLGMDEFSIGQPNFSYPVHSLYLDSHDLKLYWTTINGDKNRFKLRLRYYDTKPGSPVFFEVKRRMNNCILKQRGGVRIDAVESLLSGHFPEAGHLLSKPDNPGPLIALQRFCHLMQDMHAVPKVHIAYLREAYVSDDGAVRVTIDRSVRGEENLHHSIKIDMVNPVHCFGSYVILELKFTDRFPNWFRELVEVFGTMQSGAAKYVESIEGLGSRRLHAIGSVVEEQSAMSSLRKGDDLPSSLQPISMGHSSGPSSEQD